jgi:uncharacterized protein (DUF1800 family)
MENASAPTTIVDAAQNQSVLDAAHLGPSTARLPRGGLAVAPGAAIVSACGIDDRSLLSVQFSGKEPTPTSNTADAAMPAPGSAAWRKRTYAARFLLRAQFTATRFDIEAARNEGLELWLTRQMRLHNDGTATDFVRQNKLDVVDSRSLFRSYAFIDSTIWSQLLSGGNEVRKRFALALSEFFVVSATKLDIVWPTQAIAHYWDILNEHAFGNFRDLLEAVALSPAMGAFLDTIGNRADDPSVGRKPDENFAREVMQLFTIGLVELNMDGSPKTNYGQSIESYSNEDVAGLARVFTGYNLDASNLEFFTQEGRSERRIPHPDIVRRPMTSNHLHWEKPGSRSEHSLLEKHFLGITIPDGTDAATSLKIALDRLFNHPNVGAFFGQQMIQRLVTSNPSPAYVRRVAQVFNNNGRGIRGDLAAVFKAILLDPEANDPSGLNDMRFGKLREPAVRFVQIARSSGMNGSNGQYVSRDLSDPGSFLGQVPLRSPSVFNFFRPQYVAPASVTSANEMVSPEFQLVNEVTIPAYLNLLTSMVSGNATWINGMMPEYTAELALVENSQELLNHLDLILTAGQLRPFTRETILPALESVTITPGDVAGRLRRIHIAVALIMASHDYLIQK